MVVEATLDEPDLWAARRAFAAKFTLESKKKGGAGASQGQQYFTEDESELLVASCNFAVDGGFFLSTEVLRKTMLEMLNVKGRFLTDAKGDGSGSMVTRLRFEGERSRARGRGLA